MGVVCMITFDLYFSLIKNLGFIINHVPQGHQNAGWSQDALDIQDHFPGQKLTLLLMGHPAMDVFLCPNLFAPCSRLSLLPAVLDHGTVIAAELPLHHAFRLQVAQSLKEGRQRR